MKNKHRVLYLNKHIGPYYSDIKTQTGSINPSHATSSGKILLAYSSEETIDVILNERLEAYTENTLTNPIKLKKDFEQIRKQGYSVSMEELAIGNYSIAAPFYDYQNEIACAITIVGPVARLTDKKTQSLYPINCEVRSRSFRKVRL